VIVLDTSVLSAAFRRRRQSGAEARAVEALRRLLSADAPLAVPGIVLQELLAGVRTEEQFVRLRTLLEPFPLILAERHHHVRAARIANTCRRSGISTSTIDCLIAAIATEHDAPLFTLDRDFARIAPHCSLKLWTPQDGRA